MIIGACGYVGTGSSAVTDLLREYEENQVLDEFEFCVTYFPDGLEDLDYHLNKHRIKYTSSVVAIERFRRMVYQYYYERKRGDERNKKMFEATEKFISSITQIDWQGLGAIDNLLYGKNKPYKLKTLNNPKAWICEKIKNKGLIYKDQEKALGLHRYQFSMCPENFDEAAKAYVDELLDIYGRDRSKMTVLDQPFSGTNPEDGMRFFNDESKAIIIDRDPRDNYISNKLCQRRMQDGFQTPVDNVENYAIYHRALREKMIGRDSDRVIFITLEQLIYDYDQTREKVEKFLGLGPAKTPRKYFNPARSIANTQLVKKYPEYAEDIKRIEELLPEYLFPFEKYGDVDTSGTVFFDHEDYQ